MVRVSLLSSTTGNPNAYAAVEIKSLTIETLIGLWQIGVIQRGHMYWVTNTNSLLWSSLSISAVYRSILRWSGDAIMELDLFPEAVMKPSLQAVVAKCMTTFHKIMWVWAMKWLYEVSKTHEHGLIMAWSYSDHMWGQQWKMLWTRGEFLSQCCQISG